MMLVTASGLPRVSLQPAQTVPAGFSASREKPSSMPMFSGVAAGDRVVFSGRRQALETLFPKGVNRLEVEQGGIPDCQFLSPLYALSRNPAGARLIAGMIETTPEGNYIVSFGRHPKLRIPVAAQELADLPAEPGAKPPQATGDLGVRLFEVAYARLHKTLHPEKYADVPDNEIYRVYRTKGYHYHPGEALRDLTGWQVATHVANGGPVLEESASFAEEGRKNPKVLKDATRLLRRLAKTPERYVVVVSSIGRPGEDFKFLEPGKKILKWHDVAVENIDPRQKTITLRDPHNTRIGLKLNYEDFFSFFNGITVGRVPR